MWFPTKLGTDYYGYQERMDLLLVAACTNLTTAADLVPQELSALQLRCSAGDAGQLGMGELFDQRRTWLGCIGPRAPRGRPWPAWGQAGTRAHRAPSSWLESQGAGTLQLGTACLDCGDPTRCVSWACCVGLCSACCPWRQPCGQRRKMLSDV